MTKNKLLDKEMNNGEWIQTDGICSQTKHDLDPSDHGRLRAS